MSKCIFEHSGIHKSARTLRRIYSEWIQVAESQDNSDILNDIRKERFKLRDERTQNNAVLRRLAREETLEEIALKVVSQMSAKKALKPNVKGIANPSNKEAILLISDWHYGLDFNNAFNTYNPEECKRRVSTLLDKTISKCVENKIAKITVLNLSDLIAGRIHSQIRIQSREDVISQIIHVSEILAEFLSTLYEYVPIDYYDCLNNHSRIEPNKNESLDLESLARLVPFYLRARLTNTGIKVHSNPFSEDIITCNVLGHNVVGVHGDRDNPITALDKITLLTRKSYDLMCTAHRHHFLADEKCGCITIGNGSLMGTDEYAIRLRLHSEPSQILIICTKENVCDTIYKLNLK